MMRQWVEGSQCVRKREDVYKRQMKGTSGTSYAQYYLGINKLDMNDLNFALTIEGGHLVF